MTTEQLAGEAIEPSSALSNQEDAEMDLDQVAGDTRSESEPSQHVYQCRYCPVSFQHREQLGGHVSRLHRGKSESYRRKIEISEERKPLLMLHKAAKAIFAKLTDGSKKPSRSNLNKIKSALK